MHSIFGLYRCVLVVRKMQAPVRVRGTGTHLVLLRPTLIRKYQKKGEKSIGNRNHSGRKGGSYSSIQSVTPEKNVKKVKRKKIPREGGISATTQPHVSP